MKQSRSPHLRQVGFTLLEMTVVIMAMLILMSLGFYSSSQMTQWKLGRTASETLRSVYSAQRMYLADNPTADVGSLTSELIVPYLPNNVTVMPTVKSLTGATLTVLVTVSPPVVDAGSGVTYDPSGSGTDSLWDVGE